MTIPGFATLLLLLSCGCAAGRQAHDALVDDAVPAPEPPAAREEPSQIVYRQVEGRWRPVRDTEGSFVTVEGGAPFPAPRLIEPSLREAPQPGELDASEVRIELRQGGQTWIIEVARRTSAYIQLALPEIALGHSHTIDIPSLLQTLRPALMVERDRDARCTVTLVGHGGRKAGGARYYLSDADVIRAVFVTARRYMSLDCLAEWEMNPPVDESGKAVERVPAWEVRQRVAQDISSASIKVWSSPAYDPEQIRSALLEARPLTRAEYQAERGHRAGGVGLSGEARTPEGLVYGWGFQSPDLALLRLPTSELIRLKLDPGTLPKPIAPDQPSD